MWQVWSYAPTCDKWPHKWSHEIILTIWDNSDCMLTEWDVWLHVIVWAPCNDCDNKGKMWSLATNVTKCGKCDQHVNNVNNFTTCDRWKVWLHVINLSTCDLVWQLWPQNTSATTCDTCEIVTCDKSDHMWQVWSYVSCVTTCDMSCDPRWDLKIFYWTFHCIRSSHMVRILVILMQEEVQQLTFSWGGKYELTRSPHHPSPSSHTLNWTTGFFSLVLA